MTDPRHSNPQNSSPQNSNLHDPNVQNPNPPSPNEQAPVQPEQDSGYTGFSIAAVGVIVGAVLTLVSYPLVWFYATADPDATVTGLGSVNSTDQVRIIFTSSRLHWLPGVVAVVLLVIAVLRLIGRYTAAFNKPSTIIGAVAVGASVLAAFLVDEGFSAGIGAYLALVGSVVMLAAVAAVAFAEK
ncbi:hypothetical protein [Gordonia shandongensis]|uniref:hypothetical protein n=1 Tax=Gordonia shandongensis TaxID=376351 RepID=UPI000405E5F8|nr:hypothetical protein [Gordonia shandongensis]